MKVTTLPRKTWLIPHAEQHLWVAQEILGIVYTFVELREPLPFYLIFHFYKDCHKAGELSFRTATKCDRVPLTAQRKSKHNLKN